MGHPGAALLLVSLTYYAGANLGFLLRLPPATPSVLWPPNTILTAALLMSPPRRWWMFLLAALPAHLVAELPVWPLSLVLAFFSTNCSQALLGAAGVRWCSDAPTRFDTLGRMTVFIVAAGLNAPFLSSFLDAAAVTVLQHEPYWLVWRSRFFSNVLTELVLGPTIVMAFTLGPTWIRSAPGVRKVEAALLAAALLLVGGWAFGVGTDRPGVLPGGAVIVFVLPVILLTTVRFGPAGASVALLTTSLLAIWAGTRGRGPFTGLPLGEAVLALEILLSALAIPILCLAAVIVERREAARGLAEQLRLEALLSRLAAAFVRLPSHEMDPAFASSVCQVGELAGVDRAVLCWHSGADDRIARYAWHASGSDDIVLAPEQLPWTIARLRGDEVVMFSHLEELPVAAARDVEVFRRHGIRSAIIVPVTSGTHVRGSLSLMTPATPRAWPEGQVEWLRLVAAIFANALARKEAEDLLRAGETSKSAILASLSSSVAVLDRDGKIIDVNVSWARAGAVQGASVSPAGLGVGANLLAAWEAAASEAPQAAEAAAGIREVLGGQRAGFVLEYPRRIAAVEQWFLMSVVPLERPEGGAVVSCTEITEQKRAELEAQQSRQELAHFTRVSTMGQLTASIAHELNQPLTGILTNARAGLRFLDAVPPDLGELRALLSDIVADDKRAGEVIQRLRDILRKGERQRSRLDVNALVQDVVRLLSSDTLIRNVTVTLDLTPDPCLVDGDRVELQQVVLNLLLNAMEATAEVADGDRTIVVSTETTTVDTVLVTVQDRGPGLSEDHHDVLFEPFFTTKPGGMGMGLAIARSIIEAHDGVIWVMENPGGGAVFQFALPVHQREPA